MGDINACGAPTPLAAGVFQANTSGTGVVEAARMWRSLRVGRHALPLQRERVSKQGVAGERKGRQQGIQDRSIE
jgi:hypothetical protein